MPSRAPLRAALFASTALVLAAAVAVAASERARAARGRADTDDVSVIKIHYVTHDGLRRPAYVVLPAWSEQVDRPLPLVIAPHGRGIHPLHELREWRNLPALGDFAVVIPAGQGRRLEYFSWGYAGQIADLARMPQIVEHALPWLRIDRRRVYAVGTSMGGQEALLLLARYPRRIAGVAAFDAAVDMTRRYRDFRSLVCDERCLDEWRRPLGTDLQALARREIGGTPKTNPQAYAARSPLTYARTIAFSGKPVELWWSRTDRVVDQSDLQSGLLFRRLRELNPDAPVEGFTGVWAHASEQRAFLPIALADLNLLPTDYGYEPARLRLLPARVWP